MEGRSWPGCCRVLLGGTHEVGNWSLETSMETKAAIMAKQAKLFDGMRDC